MNSNDFWIFSVRLTVLEHAIVDCRSVCLLVGPSVTLVSHA